MQFEAQFRPPFPTIAMNRQLVKRRELIQERWPRLKIQKVFSEFYRLHHSRKPEFVPQIGCTCHFQSSKLLSRKIRYHIRPNIGWEVHKARKVLFWCFHRFNEPSPAFNFNKTQRQTEERDLTSGCPKCGLTELDAKFSRTQKKIVKKKIKLDAFQGDNFMLNNVQGQGRFIEKRPGNSTFFSFARKFCNSV